MGNGPECTAQRFVDWCVEHGVSPLYNQPGKPDQLAYIERVNRSYRTEVFNVHLFESIAELRVLTDAWLQVYTRSGPTTASTGRALHVSAEADKRRIVSWELSA